MITLIHADNSTFFSDAATKEAPQEQTSIFSSQNETQKAVQYADTLQKALDDGLYFPTVEESFEPIVAYRMIDFTIKPAPIKRAHFNSQAEDGFDISREENPKRRYSLFSCSCFQTEEEINTLMSLPTFKQHYTICSKGTILSELGTILRKGKGTHIHWFLFKDSDPSQDNFK